VPKQKAKPTPCHIGISPQQLTGTSLCLATNTIWAPSMMLLVMSQGFMVGDVASISR